MNNVSYINQYEKSFATQATSSCNVSQVLSAIRNNTETLRIVKALCDPTKLSVFLLLNQSQELTVNTLAEILNMSQSAISHALADLKKFGLVDCRSCGQLRCYFAKKLPPEKSKSLALFTQSIM